MPNKNQLLLTCVACLCMVTSALAETIYVNNLSGSDRNNGAMPKSQTDGVGPMRTLANALKRVTRGDSISLANTGTPYRECVALQGSRHSGTSFAPFVIEGNGAVLEGIDVVPAHRWEHVRGDVFRFAPERAGYQQLFLDDEVAKRLPRSDRALDTSFLPPKSWCRCQGGIHFATEKGKSVHHYDLSYAKHRVGITLYDVENVVIHDLRLRGFQLDGINAHDNAFDCVLSEVVSTGNGRSGVSVGGSSRVRLVNCELLENGDTQLNAEGWSTTHLVDSKLKSNDVPIWKRQMNTYGRGARVVVDDEEQTASQDWFTDEDEEDSKLKEDLSDLERELDVDDADSNPDDEKPANPLLDVADEQPADELSDAELLEAAEDDGADAMDELDQPEAAPDGEGDPDPFAEDSFDSEPSDTDGDADQDLFDSEDAADLFEDTDDVSGDDDPFADL